MSKKAIFTKDSKVVGPYTPAIQSGDLIFLSGQIPKNPDINKNIKEQTHEIMKSIKELVEAGNSSMDQILQCTIFMKDLSEFNDMNEVYQSYFNEPYPTRQTIGVNSIPKGYKIEISAIARVK